MSEPEISHRCPSCGASIRQRAFFCPECGRAATNDADAVPAIETAPPGAANTPGVSGDRNESAPKASNARMLEGKATRRLSEPPRDQSFANSRQDKETTPLLPAPARANVEPERSAMHDSRVKVRRATAAARDVLEENVMPQVDRLRRASSVVLEEASYDPSFRFVLVAAVLFVLFLIVLLLSKWIG